jgi:hypothetical protein
VATISGSTATIVGAGTTTITVSLAESAIYKSATTTATLTVGIPSWVQRGGDIDGEAAGDYSGQSVSLSADGTIVAIGANYNTGVNGSSSGQVRVYKYDTVSNTWSQRGGDIDGEAANNQSGQSVSLSADGTIVAIGAIYNNGNGSWSGHVRVYKYDATKTTAQWSDQSLSNYGPAGWNRLGGDIDGEAASDNSGRSVSLSADGTIVAIGARSNTGVNGISSGQVRVYKYDTVNNTWSQRGGDIDGEKANDNSGQSVSLSADGTIVAIGAYLNDGTIGNTSDNRGHVRVYKYDATKTTAQTNQSLPNFGPVGWNRLGGDIDGEAAGDYSGTSVSLSADGTIVAIGAIFNDASGNLLADAGHVRVYKYDANTNIWNQLGGDIDGEAASDQSGYLVSLSADGTIVAIGAYLNDASGNLLSNAGHVRVYKYDATKTTAQTDQSLANYGPAGWNRLGGDIDGEAVNDNSGWFVSLSSDGRIVAIGAPYNAGNGSNSGHVRVYNYSLDPTWGVFTLPTDINVYKNETITRQLTMPTSNSNGQFLVTSSNTSVATITNNAGLFYINVIAAGSTIITLSQVLSGPYAAYSTNTSLTINPLYPTWGSEFTLPTNLIYSGQTITRQLTIPTSNSNGAFSVTSSNIEVATITNNAGLFYINVIAAGSTIITLSQVLSGPYAAYSVSKLTFTTPQWIQRGIDIDGEAAGDQSGQSVSVSSDGTIVAIGAIYNDASGNLLSNAGHVRVYKYDTNTNTWSQLGGDIDGEAASDNSGRSVSLSSDGTVVAIGAFGNDASGNLLSNAGHVRVYKYDATKTTAQMNQSLVNFGPVGWNRLGGDIDGEAASDNSGISVSLSSDGTIVAIGAYYNDASGNLLSNAGHVRVYKYDATKTTAQTNQSLPNFGPVGWNRLGADIDGEAASDQSGISVTLSADGTVVAIGANYNTGVNGSSSGQVRVYKYDATKTTAQTNQSLANFGPVGWNRLGGDIDGEKANDNSGQSVSLSADGTVVAIGANGNDASGNLLADAGHVRVYKYNATKTTAQWSDQSLSNYGPAGWNRLGGDIDGEAAGDYSGWSVSLSSDGTIVAIGAIYNDASGNLLSNAGHVRVYKYDATKTTAQLNNQSLANFGPVGWNRLGGDIDGEAANDNSGWSVSLSADGTIVAIGANNNDGTIGNTSDNRGHVRVYKYQ